MSKSLKKLIDINRLREFKNKLVGTDSPCVQTGAVDQTVGGTKTFSKPIVGSVTGSSGSCTGNSATATKLATARTINGVSFDGSANITVADSTKLPLAGGKMTGDLKIATSAATSNQLRLIRGNYGVIFRNDGRNFYLLQTASGEAENGSWSSARPLTLDLSSGVCDINGNAATATTATTAKACTGNAASATKLQTARTINGTSFDGSANITTANWGTARNISITDGTNTSTAVSVNGSANVALTLPATIKATFVGNITGNVTGNCSGSSGSCTGNAATATTATTAKACTGNSATATKLATTRAINGTNFDGSAAITTANWGTARNIYVADSDGTNTGAAVSVNGSANATLKLPATIKASIAGNCSGSSGSCTGNSATATKLAAKRTIALSGAATGTATGFDGSSNITIPVTALASSAIRAQWYAAYPDGAEAHNAMWGGRNITAAFNNGTFSTNVANGTFRDIFPGDYITKSVTISGTTYTVNWVVADCDYWINKGDDTGVTTTHHVAIVPQTPIFTANMNATNTTEGGYAGSRMYRETIPACATGIVNAFGSGHILKFRDGISNYVDTGAVSSGIPQWPGTPGWWGQWVSAQCNLMSEKMVYGAPICSGGASDNTMATRQMSAFRLSEKLINYNRHDWWLRDVVNSTSFAFVGGGGDAFTSFASGVAGVRPFALLV